MHETSVMQPELPNFIGLLAKQFPDSAFIQHLVLWENVFFSLIIAVLLSVLAYLAARKTTAIPHGLQNVAEAIVGGLDAFVCGMLGSKGRRYTPFIGTLFIYILFMNLSGLVPFLKPSTSSWSTTLALGICVFVYVQYTAIKELGFFGYVDHLAGKPRGIFAFTLVIPILLFALHVLSELIKPISLSLRLRSNIWGDDVLLAVLAGFGLGGLPLFLFNMLMALLTAVVQTFVFCLLTTIYFALVMEEEHS